jgi:chromosome segregation protein
MKFARLRLSGFKSFVEATELHIRPGLTGVVGPNGCGKSNLLEALRWVMGESSARSLRVAAGGSGMDDVIFAGTAKRPSRDLAEVRLTLDNSARQAPAELNGSDEIEVSRAIMRGEGSSYALNGREARLKDVQLLFADAATGAHSPALVSQGRVAGIINSKPQERRQLLEEAAGISGLNVRRREAELRLRAADANLLRLDDVMKAAEAQAQGLRRQARAAQRYRELSERIRSAEAHLLRQQWAAAVDALQRVDRALAQAEAELAEAVQAAARAATAQADAAASLPARRQTEATAAAALQRLTTERATLLAERQGAVQRLQDLEVALGHAAADAERERARARDSAATRMRLGEELAAQSAAQEAAQAGLAPQAAEVRRAEQAATEAERALATAIEAHAAITAEARSARAHAEAARGRAERLEGERARLQVELQRLQGADAAAQLERQLADAERDLAARTAEVEAAAADIQQAERAGQAARAAAEAVERAVAAARTEVSSLEAEAAALDRLLGSKASGPSKAARAAVAARPGFEAALAAALGEDLSAVIGPPERPQRHWLGIRPGAKDPELPAGCTALAPEVEAPAELARRLAQVGVVEDAPSPELLAALRPGQRLVSRQGWLWRWDGFVAPPGGQSAAVAETLAQDNRRREIAQALAAPRARQQAAEAELALQKAALGEAQAAERSGRARRQEAERVRDQLGGRMQGLRAAQAQAQARASALQASIERLNAEGASALAEAQAALQAVAALPDSSRAAEAVAAARTLAEQSRAALAQGRATAAGLERTLAESAARVARLTRERADWEARDRQSAESLAALEQRIADLGADRARLLAEPDALDARLHLLEREVATADAARAAAADAVMAADLALSELDRAARAAEARVADLREGRATLGAQAVQAREKVAELVAEARERFGAEPGALDVADDDGAELEPQLAALKAERERIGVVNLRADIELAEIEAVLGEQQRERGELETAIHRLRGSIGTLNREGRARLMAAYADVDRHFRDLFVTLFGGGSAELTLVESEDPLEAGLEIRAQPPGKKLQSLSLLSGGEQALTAIALIFALFRTNPAPICVLDEVDAPLDDANVERFTRLLHHMAELTDTRFLIVTHNPITMAAMHRLYGVTMAEPGVSQLVSVELLEAEQLVAA